MSALERRMAPRQVVGYLERMRRAYTWRMHGCIPDLDVIL